MSWGSKQTSDQQTDITAEEFFTTYVALNPGEIADVQMEVQFVTSPTDDAIVSVYTTLDTSSETWDKDPFMQFYVLRKSNTQNYVSFLVSGVFKFRISVKRSGGTDTLTNARFYYRLDSQ